MVTHVIKRAGHAQPYLETKLHASIMQACRAVRTFEGEAEIIAERISQSITAWLETKAEVTSYDLHVQAAQHLANYHAEAAYAYDSHDYVV